MFTEVTSDGMLRLASELIAQARPPELRSLYEDVPDGARAVKEAVSAGR
jgi:hypothetical protein